MGTSYTENDFRLGFKDIPDTGEGGVVEVDVSYSQVKDF